MNETENITQELIDGICGYAEECPFSRFVYISIGGLVSLFGVLSNLLLLHTFLSRSLPNSPSHFYPAILAGLDCLFCVAYIMLFFVDVNMVYLQNEELFLAYHTYIIPTLVFSRMNQLAIPYLLILATMEKWSWVTQKFRQNIVFHPTGRLLTVIITLVVCCLLRIPSFWHLGVQSYPNCEDPMRKLSVVPTDFAINSNFFNLYDTYFMTSVQTMIPFAVLISLNLIIARRLARHDAVTRNAFVEHGQPPSPSEGDDEQMPRSERRRSMGRVLSTLRIHRMPSSVRSAVYTMITIVCTYLISNSLHIFLMLLERSEADILYSESDPSMASPFYTAMSDLVSVSYMTSSAIRIVVYAVCNPTIRKQLHTVLVGDRRRKKSIGDYDKRDSTTSVLV